MKFSKIFILGFSSLVLIACSSNRESLPRTKAVSTDTIVLNNGSTINFITENAINGQVVEDTNNYLNIVTRGDTAQVVGVKVVQFATSLFTLNSGSISSFTKEELKGKYVESVPNKTMDILTPELYAILKKINANKNKNNTVTVQPYKFKLIYDGLTDNKYNFIYTTYIRSNNFEFVCSDKDLALDDKVKPFSDWEMNNYQLVQDVTLKAINTCMDRLKLHKNITELEKALN
ncbi:hypothetical protein A9G24_07445 [Gilliamella sp. App6-5]|uniref:hypothetical protein n=1 Tax=Gilliamella sp. App6-5 TaxID=3120232 RepID=UPI00080DD966|nr:hypothetical protein [Gilliamella apicola]OCG13701.1 hypothetical protein A9G24_07445 [Gilliamella apicola]